MSKTITKKYTITAEWDGRYSLRVNGIHVDSFATVFSARKSIERRITATLQNWKRYSYTAITRAGDNTISAEPPPRPVQVLVRMPPVLHEQLKRMADTNEISLNKLIVEILRDY